MKPIEDWQRVGFAQARAYANSLLDTLAEDDLEPVNLNALIAQRNLATITHRLNYERVGMLVVRADGRGVIVSNQIHSEARQRFAIAHALGHYLLHWQPPCEVVHYDFKTHGKDNRVEQEADVFASALLMPTRVLEPWAKAEALDMYDDPRVIAKALALKTTPTALTVKLKKLDLYASQW